MIFNKDQDYWASCYSTNEFLLIETYSGLGKTRRDPIYNPHILSLDADDKCIGKDVLRALLNSRTLTSLDERVAFFDLEKGKQQYVIWIAMLMEKYGYKTKRALFKNMKNWKFGLVIIYRNRTT